MIPRHNILFYRYVKVKGEMSVATQSKEAVNNTGIKVGIKGGMSVATQSKEAVNNTGIKVGDAWLRRHWPDDAVSVLHFRIFHKFFFFRVS